MAATATSRTCERQQQVAAIPLSWWILFSFLATNCRCCCFQMMREVCPRPSVLSDASSRRWRWRLRCDRWQRNGGATAPPPTSEDGPSKGAAERLLSRMRPRLRLALPFLSEAAAIVAFPFTMPLPLVRLPPMPRATTRSAVTVFGVVICFHLVYTALLHRMLRGRFLSMVLLSEVAAVPDYGDGREDGRIATTSDGGDVPDTKKSASERLPRIIRELRFIGDDGSLDDEVAAAETGTRTGIERSAVGAGTMEVLWDGYLLYACAGRTRLTDGWYAAGDYKYRSGSYALGGKGGGRTPLTSPVLRVKVSGEGRKATVYLHRAAGVLHPMSTSDLLRRRKPLCIIEDLEERMGWRRVLGDARRSALVGGKGYSPSSSQPLSGSYSFVYRDYVGVEEKFVMVGRRGGLSPLRLTEDTVLTLHEDGTCSLVDSGSILGILPVKTRNVGRWYGRNSPLGVGERRGGVGGSVGAAVPPHWIEWETSSLRIGWGSRMLGRTIEMTVVTEALRAGPWPVLSLPVTGDDPDGEGEDLLLVNRPSYGWLVLSRVHG